MSVLRLEALAPGGGAAGVAELPRAEIPRAGPPRAGLEGWFLTRQLLGKPVAEAILQELRAGAPEAVGSARRPSLASVHLGAGGPFAFYLRQQARSAASVGFQFRDVALPESATTAQLSDTLRALNVDPSVDAVLVQHPLPAGVDFQGPVDLLSPEKDVDGVGSVSLGRLVEGRPSHAPAVAVGVLRILRHYGISTSSRRVAVIGRSSTVGRPLALLLTGRGESGDATVTIAHSKTARLTDALAGAEIIVSCAGAPGLLTKAVVPQGSVLIDVGLSSIPDPASPTGSRAAGDADAASLEGWVEALTPVPGGVGPVTAAQLMSNVYDAWRMQARGPE